MLMDMQNWEVLVIWFLSKLKELSGKYNNGKTINIITQKLGYMVRGGDPDALDSIVPMAYGNLALDLILKGVHGRIVVLKNGRYGDLPIDVVTKARNWLMFLNIITLKD